MGFQCTGVELISCPESLYAFITGSFFGGTKSKMLILIYRLLRPSAPRYWAFHQW